MAKKKTQLTKEEERQAYEAIRPQLAAAFQFAQAHLNFGMDDWEWNSHIHASTIYKVLKGSLKTCKPCVIGMLTLSLPKEVQHMVQLKKYYPGYGALWFWYETPRQQAIMGLKAIAAYLSNEDILELNREWAKAQVQNPEKN